MFERTKTKSNRNRLVFLGMKEIDSFANVIHHVLEKNFALWPTIDIEMDIFQHLNSVTYLMTFVQNTSVVRHQIQNMPHVAAVNST